MHLAVLGANGGTGRWLVRQGLERGHTVTAVTRRVEGLDLTGAARLRPIAADVTDPESIARALRGADVVLSGLGLTTGGPPDLLTLGARAVAAAAPPRIIWLGAFGTGRSATATSAVTRQVLRVALGRELADKAAAEETVLAAGGVVVHAGPLSNGPLAARRRSVPLTEAPRRRLPRPISRATVAAVMLDEAEHGDHRRQVVIALDR